MFIVNSEFKPVMLSYLLCGVCFCLFCRKEVMQRIEHYVQLIVTSIAGNRWPQLTIHGRTETLTWKLARQKRKGLLLFLLLGKVHSLLRTGTNSTKRLALECRQSITQSLLSF